MEVILFLSAIAVVGYMFYRLFAPDKTRLKNPKKPFPNSWRIILVEKVLFYNNLSPSEKERFEYKIQEFLLNCRITGVKTEVTYTDRVLVAASAVIPIFAFPEWQHYEIDEVLLYPGAFDQQFSQEGEGRNILGMVGTGYMDGKMVLSKKALHQGFAIENDKRNTAIHEFVHLIDKADGTIDGIPSLLLDKQYILPWLDVIKKKIAEITGGRSDINPYGATNDAEFFAVLSEYFFERPKLLKSKHPDLYQLLEIMFDQKMSTRLKKLKVKSKLGRNDPCPCGSGLKFKKCCGLQHTVSV